MIDTETYKFMDKEVKTLWPEWKLTDAELETWVRNLRPFKYETAKRATQEFYATREGGFKIPKLYAIIEKAKFYSRAENPAPKINKELKTDVFVQCIENKNPVRLYHFCPVYCFPTERQADHDYVMQCAEAMCKRCSGLYGGTWIVVQSTNYQAMNKQWYDYRIINKDQIEANKRQGYIKLKNIIKTS